MSLLTPLASIYRRFSPCLSGVLWPSVVTMLRLRIHFRRTAMVQAIR
ncbi:hypothetical protein QVN83_08260 [Yersinia frederiksenii]|nr:hypothetical protein [Yersinia frederiksenii]MDN0118957.1 hypothetical protein [Yersinia frederiksenii]